MLYAAIDAKQVDISTNHSLSAYVLSLFLGAGAFADKEPIGLRIAHPQHRLLALPTQRTRPAPGHRIFERGPIHLAHRGGQ